MRSRNAVKLLLGNQEPRIRREPRHHHTDGGDAAELSSSYGLAPDPWQRLVLDSWLGLTARNVYTSQTCGLLVPRQNGKNALIEMREFYGTVLIGEKILHTAHEVKTSRKAFNRLCSFFENERDYPELAELVLQIRKTNGQEAITLKNGASVEFSARSRGAARGFTVDVVICDEAQELTDEQLEALLFTQSAAPLKNPQFIVTGTPPRPNIEAEVFGRMRKAAIAQPASSRGACWHEWSVDKIGDVTDRARWYETNPALGIRIKESSIETELSTSSEDGFARERLSWWSSSTATRILSEEDWNPLETREPPADGKHAFGVKFAVDGSTVSLAVAIKPKEGVPYVEVLEHRSMTHGITWLADLIEGWRSKVAVVVVDGKSGAGDLLEKLRLRKFPPKAMVPPTSGEVATAASSFLNAVHEGTVSHFGQKALDDSALNAQRRPIGNGGAWGWGGIGESDSTLIEACTLAYWGVMTTKRNPGRGSRLQ